MIPDLALQLAAAAAVVLGAWRGWRWGLCAALAAVLLHAGWAWSRWPSPGGALQWALARSAWALPAAVLAGWLSDRRERAALFTARRTWTALRSHQIAELLSWTLYQLREYMISVSSVSEALTLSIPAESPLAEKAARLKKLASELNQKAARLLGDKSPLTTQTDLARVTFTLPDLARESLEEARAAFGAPNARAAIVVQDPIPPFSSDRRALKTVLLAVFQNALEACAARPGAGISVLLRAEGPRALIEVADDGGGIPESAQATLFEPFFAAKAGSGGLGLGLPMARRLMERLGGTVKVKSKQGFTAVLVEAPVQAELPVVRNEESTWAGRRGQI